MTKYKLSKQELQDHWDDQIRFIQKSIKEFDRGDEKKLSDLQLICGFYFMKYKNQNRFLVN